MLKANNQLNFCLSSHASLFEVLIEKDNFWRQLKDEEKPKMLKECLNIFCQKNYYKLSDRDLIARTKTDMLFKYFLDYAPEEINLIDPSLLTVFRRERLSNNDNEEETSTNLMDKLIAKTVEIALNEGVIEVKNKII